MLLAETRQEKSIENGRKTTTGIVQNYVLRRRGGEAVQHQQLVSTAAAFSGNAEITSK